MFERNKVRASSHSHRRDPTSSPRSTLLHVLVDEKDNNDDDGSLSQPSVVESSLSGGGSSAASSSAAQDLHRALDDTEALIQSLLG